MTTASGSSRGSLPPIGADFAALPGLNADPEWSNSRFFQNVAIVEIQFLFWAIRMPRALLVVLLLAIGMAIGWFLHSFIRHRDKP